MCSSHAAGVHIYRTDPEPQSQQPGTRLGVTRGKAAAVFDSSFGAVQLQGRARKDEHLKIHHHMVSFGFSAFLCHAATVARSHDSITDVIFFSNAGGEKEKRNTEYSNHIHTHSHCHCYLGNELHWACCFMFKAQRVYQPNDSVLQNLTALIPIVKMIFL